MTDHKESPYVWKILDNTFGATFGTRKLFFKKTHPCGSAYKIATSACLICHFAIQILQPSAQNPFRAEDFCSIIIEAHHKSHRKPTDVLEISYGGPETCKERGITFGTQPPNN